MLVIKSSDLARSIYSGHVCACILYASMVCDLLPVYFLVYKYSH